MTRGIFEEQGHNNLVDLRIPEEDLFSRQCTCLLGCNILPIDELRRCHGHELPTAHSEDVAITRSISIER